MTSAEWPRRFRIPSSHHHADWQGPRTIVYDLDVGTPIPTISYELTPGRIRRVAQGTHDPNPWYTEGSPFGGIIAPPVTHAKDHVRLYYVGMDYGLTNLAYRVESEFHHPSQPGQKRIESRLADKGLLDGWRQFFTVAMDFYDEAGVLLQRHRFTCVQGRTRDGEPPREAAPAAPSIPHAPARQPRQTGQSEGGLRPGLTLGPLTIAISQAELDDFSGPGRGLHNDLEAARRAGYPGVLIEGLLIYSYASQLLVGAFGADWFTSGKIDVSIPRKTYYPGTNTISAWARVIDVKPDGAGARASLEVWAQGDTGGPPALQGSASCTAPAGAIEGG